jgi:natural product precursor
MKRLNKLQINSEKLMKNEEMIALRGGYGSINCGNGCGAPYVPSCASDDVRAWCNANCPGWTSAICAGW